MLPKCSPILIKMASLLQMNHLIRRGFYGKTKRSLSIERKLKDGLGQGFGSDYKPWINIQDVPLLGRSTRLKGTKVPRQHEFLSDLGINYFYLLEYSDSVIDIREQFV